MDRCNKKHFVKNGDKRQHVPCYYIAGVCVVDPTHQGGLERFLSLIYPFYHSNNYEESKHMQTTIVPNNIRFANENG